MNAANPSAFAGRRRVVSVLTLTVAIVACGADNASVTDTASVTDASVELRDEVGPHVEAAERDMAMTVDAVEVAGDDILVRVRVANSDDGYLDMGVQDTIYGPLLVMRDDRANRYESYAIEPAGIPGRRIANLSFRLAGPLDRRSMSFTLELATQRGPLISPSARLPERDGVRWRIDDASAVESESADAELDPSVSAFAARPRLPDLIDFRLETAPLPADR